MWCTFALSCAFVLGVSAYYNPYDYKATRDAMEEYSYYDSADYLPGSSYSTDDDYSYAYAPTYTDNFKRDRNSYARRLTNMKLTEKSNAPRSHRKPQREKIYVPVIVKKKTPRKRKIISSHSGFYIPGGTQMFGRFNDLHSCEKACEITPTCFAGDYNPWVGKCYLHSNITACAALRAHKAVTHFKKVPCDVLETSRGYVVLGVNTINGIEIQGIDSLQDCIKRCASAGGGVASKDTNIIIEGQICCHIDYDFSNHKCYFHACVNGAHVQANFCYGKNVLTDAPKNSVAHPTTVSITICPRSAA